MDADNTQFGAGSGSTGGAGNSSSTGNTADLNNTTGGTGSSGTGGFSGYGGSTGNTGTEGYASAGAGGSDFGTTGSDFGAAGGLGSTGEQSNARKLADKARDVASQAKQKAGEQLNSSVDKGRTRAADTLQEVARTLMGTGTGDPANNPATQYLSKAGEQVQRFADYLQNTEPRQLVSETENFARRQPALFLGSAFALGVLAARFLKATRDETEGYGSGGEGRLYDRETALSSYRDGVSGYSPSLGISETRGPLGDDELDWPSGMGNVDGTSTGSSTTGLGDDLGSTGSSGYNSTR